MPFSPVMKVGILTIFGLVVLWGADEERLARALKAQADYDRVALAPAPQLRDALGCVQSQAALVPVSTAEEMPLVRFRKGYCALAVAAVSADRAAYQEAVTEFNRAIEAWPARFTKNNKLAPEPVSSGLRVAAAVAKLKASDLSESDITKAYDELSRAVQTHACPASLMAPGLCESLVEVGQRWAGWVALERDLLEEAQRVFSVSPRNPWAEWTAGKIAFREAAYAPAAAHYKAATEKWEASARDESRSLLERISPEPDLAAAHTELGGAQLLAGDTAAAVATLTTAIRESPSSAKALFLRGRAKEIAGQQDAALADFNLASRTALAGVRDLSSGEGHLYRGIVQFRRKDFARAETEFATALNFEIPAALRADASAWRNFSVVAGGSCGASRTQLERSMAGVSPYFPKAEARAVAVACRPSVTADGSRVELPK